MDLPTLCFVPTCQAPATHYSHDGTGYCAPHGGIPPAALAGASAYWRYDPEDHSIILWAPYETLNGPEEAPGTLWPVFKIKLATGYVLTLGTDTKRVAQTMWEAIAATTPADLGAQVAALEGQVETLSARYAGLAAAIAKLEGAAEALARQQQPGRPGGLILPGERN